ncbi:hypothetical protein Pint_19336 [Pistacia integerrima]|uniref:Uncharacterized protein n=1 Tax=Pistacia integerrima TaxID=434235 RepID=A0ACC0YY61_9ROSI|nr:hypothetical protein Pint_19336 [Pistacia integerrima]
MKKLGASTRRGDGTNYGSVKNPVGSIPLRAETFQLLLNQQKRRKIISIALTKGVYICDQRF